MSDSEPDIIDEINNETSEDSTDSELRDSQLKPVYDATQIGKVTTQDGPSYVGRKEYNIKVYIDSEHRSSVKVGDYIQIPYEEDSDDDRVLFGVVKSIAYGAQSSFNDQMDGGFGAKPGEHELSYVCSVQPISTITASKDSLESNPVDCPPRPKTEVKKVENNEILRTGLSLPENGFFVGGTAVSNNLIPDKDNPLDYRLFNPNASDGTEEQGEPVVFRHALVAGSTGQGKTHFSKNLLRQFAICPKYTMDIPPEESDVGESTKQRERRLSMCIIDPEDEYSEMRNDSVDLTERKRQELLERGIEFGGIKNDPDTEIEVFMPVDSNTEDRTKDGAQQFGIPFSIVQERPELLMAIGGGEPTRQAIRTVVRDYFEDNPNNPTYNDFSEHVEENLEEDEDINENVEQAVRRRVLNSAHRRVFDNGPVMMTDIIDDIIKPGKVSVISTGHLRGAEDKLIVLSILSHVIDNKIGSNVSFPRIKGTPLLICLDEAHEYLSEPSTRREQYIVQNMRQAAKRGRKDKLGLFMITQNPQDIDLEIRTQINTKIYLGLERNVIESNDVFVPKDFKEQIPQFDKGQAVIEQPNVRPVEIKGLSTRLTQHQS